MGVSLVEMAGRASVDDLRNPFAELASGEVVHVGHVRDREKGPFICPECRTALRLRMGEVRQRHFAHEPGNECPSPVETMLHRFAKELIARELRLGLPALCVSAGTEQREALPANTVDFTRVELETVQGGIRPDIILYRDDPDRPLKLLVEVRVTHAVGSQKRE